MAELGQKISCQECGGKFYDLGRPDATCPKCGHKPEPPEEAQPKRTAKRAAPKRVAAAAKAEPAVAEASEEEAEAGDGSPEGD